MGLAPTAVIHSPGFSDLGPYLLEPWSCQPALSGDALSWQGFPAYTQLWRGSSKCLANILTWEPNGIHPCLCKQVALANLLAPLTSALGLGGQQNATLACPVANPGFAFLPKPPMDTWQQEANLPKIQPSWSPPALPGRSPLSLTVGPRWSWWGPLRPAAGKGDFCPCSL